MRKQAWLRAAAGLTAAALVLTACSQKSNEGTSDDNNDSAAQSAGWPETPLPDIKEGKKGGTFRFGLTEPTAIDPYNAQESEGLLVTKYLFTGLIQVDPLGEVKPGVATKWEANDDCTEWTFDLKTGTKFHNGEEVTSASFKRGWERVAAKDSASEVAYHLAGIEGFDEMQAGTATSLSGVDATDPAKLVVKLADPNCEFYLRTFHPVFSPVPSTAGSPTSNPAYVEQPIGNGPFMMDGPWQHNVGIKLKRFDDYNIGHAAYLDSVEITITANGSQDEYAGYQNGTFDWARMPTPVLPQARSTYEPQNQWITRNTNGMNYLLVMVTQKPLDSAKARKALSMAIDRDAIINGVFKGSQSPADSLVPPAFKDAYQKGVCDACEFNLDEAKKLAKEAGLTEGTELNFQFNVDAGHEEWTAAVKDQLETNLGLKVNLGGVQFTDLLNNEQQPNSTGIYRAAWGADYPTPGNFLEPLLSTGAIGAPADQPTTGDNRGRYSNKKFDDLLDEAKGEKDDAKRVTLYQQAEKIAIGDDLALIPLWNRTQHRLANTSKFINLRMDFSENPDLYEISTK
ncbi:peptide ABC transporter substrate-binding protein [Actinophytocola oryzae]|uniref:Oligopeptide transport system substrate-binding protein n=1 Tax=Actinophytocola oryzae TaxID=502181 RepID=A0A4V3FSD8_9PSEU|nr:ABC transporter substrate-binding protein [Actinophytocola oryzae]TDV47081.1 oligopeptide transport system substrate-binding protein [Actinophytocola oryzae]